MLRFTPNFADESNPLECEQLPGYAHHSLSIPVFFFFFLSCRYGAYTLAPSKSGNLFIMRVLLPWTQNFSLRSNYSIRVLSTVAVHLLLQLFTTTAGLAALNLSPHYVFILLPMLFLFLLFRFVNIGQTLIHEDIETSISQADPMLVRVSLDLPSFVGLQSISAHVIGNYNHVFSTWHWLAPH